MNEPKKPNKRDDQNGPGMNNGIPEGMEKGEATALPHSDRENTETAANPDA